MLTERTDFFIIIWEMKDEISADGIPATSTLVPKTARSGHTAPVVGSPAYRPLVSRSHMHSSYYLHINNIAVFPIIMIINNAHHPMINGEMITNPKWPDIRV
jgi:hypothetical protein